MRVQFTKTYNHTWPSRAMTEYPAGLEDTVKREVGEAAIAAGCAKELPSATPAAERTIGPGKLPGNLPPDLATPDALLPNRAVDGAGDSK